MTDLTWALSSCVLIGAVAAIRALFGARMRPGLRYALWGLVLLRLLVPAQLFTAPWGVSAELPKQVTERSLYVLPTDSVSLPASVLYDDGPISEELLEIWSDDRARMTDFDSTTLTYTRYAAKWSGADVLRAVWLGGVAVTAAVFLASNLRFYCTLRKRRKPLDADGALRVYAVENLSSSCLFGNAVYVAAETARDETRLRHVLAHERSHHRHGDHIWALLRCAALALHWYDPLVWWAAALSRQDSELCADAGALKALGEDEREAYGATLIELSARRAARAPLLRAATTMTNGKKSLRERVTMIARRPRMSVAVVLAVVCIAAVAAGCAFAGAERREEPVSAPSESRAGVDAYLDAVRANITSATYYAADGGGERTAKVLGTRVAYCNKLAELYGLSPDGTLELYDYLIETKLDVPADSIALAGGMYATEDGWCDLEGQGGHSLVVLRRADGGMDALFDRPNNDDRGGLYYYEESAEEMLYDFYVRSNGLDLPLYTIDLPVSVNGGNCPARRWDGDGWYVYIPVQAWREASSGGAARWVSGYNTGSELSVRWLASRDESELARRSRSQDADTNRYSYYDGSLHTDVWLYDALDGGCWQVLTRYDTSILIRSDMAGLEPTVLEAMAASFTLEPRAAQDGVRPTAAELTEYGVVYDEASIAELPAYPHDKFLLYLLGADGAYAEAAEEELYQRWCRATDHDAPSPYWEQAVSALSPERAARIRERVAEARSRRATPFTDIMGLDGWYEAYQTAPHHSTRRYFAATADGGGVEIGESFGFELDDHIVDLDGDGVSELLCNCVYGGDGAERVYVYRRNGGTVERGCVDRDKLGNPGWTWGANATSERYDPARGRVVLTYPTGDGGASAELELAAYEAFDFEPYAELVVSGQRHVEEPRAFFAQLSPADARLSLYDRDGLQGGAGGASALMAADYLAALSDIAWETAAPMGEDERARDWRIELATPDWRLTSYQDARKLCVEADGGTLWLAARQIPDRQYAWLPYATLSDWLLDAVTAERCRAEGTPLTREELKAWREALSTMQGDKLNVASCFFTSTYADPRDLDLAAFLAYCPLGETVSDDWGTIIDDAERAAVTASENYPGDFVPTHRYRASDVNDALMQYAGVTLDELTTDWRRDERLLYLPEYDAFYNFTSDFGPGVFEARYGERDGDAVTLWSDDAALRLRLTDGGWHILSHLPR